MFGNVCECTCAEHGRWWVWAVVEPVGLRVVLFAEKTELIFWDGLIALDVVTSVPPFAHDEAGLGGEAAGGGLFKLVYLGSESEGVVVPVWW